MQRCFVLSLYLQFGPSFLTYPTQSYLCFSSSVQEDNTETESECMCGSQNIGENLNLCQNVLPIADSPAIICFHYILLFFFCLILSQVCVRTVGEDTMCGRPQLRWCGMTWSFLRSGKLQVGAVTHDVSNSNLLMDFSFFPTFTLSFAILLTLSIFTDPRVPTEAGSCRCSGKI